jgi:hypothetical protein
MHYRTGPRGFPFGSALIGPGTEINTDDIAWSQLANVMPPIDAQALDDATYQVMQQHYTSIGWGHLMGGPPLPSNQTKEETVNKTKPAKSK